MEESINIKSFEMELKDIGATNPIIIAFGNDSFKILKVETSRMWVSAFIFIFAKNEIMALQTDIIVLELV